MKLLIDTNIMLDILQKRKPFFNDSYLAMQRAIEMDMECLVSASAATDIFYLLRKSLHSADSAKKQVEQLAQIVTFADVLAADIHAALAHTMSDFEDAVLDAVARRHGTSLILTRNTKDFADSMVSAITPTDFLSRYPAQSTFPQF